MEIKNENKKSLVNKLEYQVFDDKKNYLDLSLCSDTNIKVFYALKKDLIELSTISFFKDSDIDVFNIKDAFFNDI